MAQREVGPAHPWHVGRPGRERETDRVGPKCRRRPPAVRPEGHLPELPHGRGPAEHRADFLRTFPTYRIYYTERDPSTAVDASRYESPSARLRGLGSVGGGTSETEWEEEVEGRDGVAALDAF